LNFITVQLSPHACGHTSRLLHVSCAKISAMTPWLIAAPGVVVGLAGVTAYGAVHPRAQFFGNTICRTNRPQKLAITFDDGPNPAITPKLLDLLGRYSAKATFFLVGKYVRESPALSREIVARGHIVGNHTESHPRLCYCGPEKTRTELLRCSDAIRQAIGEGPRWFRPPFGYRSPWLGGIVQQLRMRTVMWTLMPGDWRDKSPEWLIERMQPIAAHARKKLPAGTGYGGGLSGDILCLHDGNYREQNADRTRTITALEFWLPRWSDLGLEFVTISQAQAKAVEG
jgi:peptidoglycan-N-acetylglucosamine deacetylase